MTAIYSMTAFAQAQGKANDYQLTWELRTVNHRYLEATFRLPDSVRGAEEQLRKLMRERLKRGKLDATLKIEKPATRRPLTLNRDALTQLLEAADQLKSTAPQASPLSSADILSWPGILMEEPESGDETQALGTAAIALFTQGLDELVAARAREGQRVLEVVNDQVTTIGAELGTIEPITTQLMALQRSRLNERVAELAVTLDSDRLEQEVALLAQKADVREEIDRIGMHITEVRELLATEGPHGRKLDFVSQELNREANTLGAKSIHQATTQAAINLKVVIEQFREQIQNIE